MTRQNRHHRFVQALCLLCVLTALLGLAIACTFYSRAPSDLAVVHAARAFARMLRASGESYDEMMRLAVIESQTWGPKAKLFVDTVIQELENG